MEKKNEFKPYIPADKIVPEFTVTSIVIGIILAVVFGAANAYLGLIVGMTVSASIPAAVISMGIIRVILRKDSILENNLVQTIGSAGESVAAGAIFTLPALFIWAEEGKIAFPSMMTIFLVALFGGVLGICLQEKREAQKQVLYSQDSVSQQLTNSSQTDSNYSQAKSVMLSKAMQDLRSVFRFFLLLQVSASSVDRRFQATCLQEVL